MALNMSKTDLFYTKEGQQVSFDPAKFSQFLPHLEKCERDLAQGIRMDCIYVDMPKDELRSHAKADKADTRFVSMCPVDYVVLARKHFGAFAAAVYKTKISNNCTLGINPLGSEWSTLVEHLDIPGSQDGVLAGDFSGFDTGHSPQILWAIFDRIEDWYGVKSPIRRTLWYEIIHSRHLARDPISFVFDLIYQWDHAMPSGNPLTSIINSFYTLTLITLCWHRTFPTRPLCDISAYMRCVANGDDSVIRVQQNDLHVFNQDTVASLMGDLGCIWTCELSDSHNKGDAVSSSRSLGEVSFLKRGFRFERGMWRAPLALGTITQSLFWVKPGTNAQDVCDNYYRELSLHPQCVWDEWVSKVHAPACLLGMYPTHPVSKDVWQDISATDLPAWLKAIFDSHL